MVQQVRKSIIALVFLPRLRAALLRQAPSAPLAIKPDAPDRYIVVPGDTLWGISQRYTDSPWRWPELWNLNREQIRNPHLIYPGYVIVLDRERGQLTIGGTDRAPAPTTPGAGPAPTPPQLPPPRTTAARRRLRHGQARAARSRRVACQAGDPEHPALGDRAVPVAAAGDRARRPGQGADHHRHAIRSRDAFDRQRRVRARHRQIAKDETWYVYRKGDALVDPDTNQTLAYEAVYLGTAQLTRPGEPATVTLTDTVQEVGAGDKLVAAGRPQPVNYAPRAPSSQIKGRVIAIYGGVGKVGEAGPLSRSSASTAARPMASKSDTCWRSTPSAAPCVTRPGSRTIRMRASSCPTSAPALRLCSASSTGYPMHSSCRSRGRSRPLDVVQTP